MKVRRIVSDEKIDSPSPTIDYLIALATPIDLRFDAYALNRLSPAEMQWDYNKEGHRFRLRLD